MALWYWKNTQADNEWYPLANHNFNDAIDGLGAAGTPGDTDSALLHGTASSANCLVDGVVPAAGRLASLATTAYLGTFTIDNAISTVDWLPCQVTFAGSAGVSITGRCEATLATDLGTYSGTWVLEGAGAQNIGDIGAPDASYPDLTMQGAGTATIAVAMSAKTLSALAGTITLGANATCEAFVLNGGTIIGTGFTLYTGDLTYTAGTATGLSATLVAGTHDIDWDTASSILHLNIPTAAKGNLTGTTYVNESTFGAGVGGVSLTTATGDYIVVRILGNDKWHQTGASGTVSPHRIFFQLMDGDYEVGLFDGSAVGSNVLVQGDVADRVLTMTDDWTTGTKTLVIYHLDAGFKATLDTNAHGLTAGAVAVGVSTDDDKSGALDCGTGIHSIASLAAGHATGNLANALDFASSNLRVSGTLDGDNIACTNTAGIVNGGTVNNVNNASTPPLLHFGAPGASNTNVINPSAYQTARRRGRAA